MSVIPHDREGNLTQDRLRQLLDYDPKTGIFRWSASICRPGCVPGAIAGCLRRDNTWRIRIDYILYHASRLAWIYMIGSPSTKEIDHINRNRSDNRWCNLREATRQQNMINVVRAKPHKSGFSGVDHIKDRYRARVKSGGRTVHLGMYDSGEEAYAVALAAKSKLHGAFVAKEN